MSVHTIPAPGDTLPPQVGNALEFPESPTIQTNRIITRDDVMRFVEPGLEASDIRLVAELGGIARQDLGTVMNYLGMAARAQTYGNLVGNIELIAAENRLRPEEDKLSELSLKALEVAHRVRRVGLEHRFRANGNARRRLIGEPYYHQLLDEANTTAHFSPREHALPYRKVQYYTLGKVSCMIASYNPDTAVQ